MALSSETSDTRQQFTWSHCDDMGLTVPVPCHAGVTSKTMCEHCFNKVWGLAQEISVPSFKRI